MYLHKRVLACVAVGLILVLSGCTETTDDQQTASAGGESAGPGKETPNSGSSGGLIQNPGTGVPATPVVGGETYIVNVFDSGNDGHIPLWTLDGNLAEESRWSAMPGTDGKAPWIQYQFSGAANIQGVDIAFFRGKIRSTTFQIETSADGVVWNEVMLGNSSGASDSFETFEFDRHPAKFIRLTGYGNSESNWTSIREVRFPGIRLATTIQIPPPIPTIRDDDPDSVNEEDDVIIDSPVVQPGVDVPLVTPPVAIVSVVDSHNDGHLPEWTLDGVLSDDSRWSARPAESKNPWVQYQLEGATKLSSVGIAFFRGDLRGSTFDIVTSLDGKKWTLAYTGTSSGRNASVENFSFGQEVVGSYIRIVGYGNSESDWTSILEVDIPGADKSPWLASSRPDVVIQPDEDDEEIVDPNPPAPQPGTGGSVTPPVVDDDTPAKGDIVVATGDQLRAALDKARGGEVILLKNGNYGSLVINQLYSSYVVLRSENRFGAVFSRIELDGNSSGYVQFDRIQAAGITATNGAHHLKYTNSKFSSTVYFKGASNVVIDNNIIDVDGGLHALLMNSVSSFELTRNFIARAQEDLMRLTGDSDGGLIENNIFYDTLPRNIPTEANKCEYNHTDALQMFGVDDKNPRNITIRGNLFYDDPRNNQVRPESCTKGRTGVRLNMQGIFMSDPKGNAYENILVEENLAYLGSANSLYINGATSNVVVRNNTLLPWVEGGGGSIRVVEKAKRTNKGLNLYGNIASAVSDETTSLSDGMKIGENYVYKGADAAPKSALFQGGGQGATWQHYLPVKGSAVDFGTGFGAQKRLKQLMGSGSEALLPPQHF